MHLLDTRLVVAELLMHAPSVHTSARVILCMHLLYTRLLVVELLNHAPFVHTSTSCGVSDACTFCTHVC